LRSLQAEKKLPIGEEEFNRYYTQYFGKIKAYVYGYLKNEEAAKDIAQGAFTKLYLYRDSLKDDKIINWLYRVAYNATMDYFKENSREMCTPWEIEPFTRQGPDTILQQQYEKEVIISVLRKLPSSQRTAILLKDVKGYSYEEIAAAMELSLAAVKSLLFRGRKKFIKYFREVMRDEMQYNQTSDLPSR